MADAARQPDTNVIDLIDYLRETLREMDLRRAEFAMRLAVLEAESSTSVRDADNDYVERTTTGEPYEGKDASDVLSDAYRRYGQS